MFRDAQGEKHTAPHFLALTITCRQIRAETGLLALVLNEYVVSSSHLQAFMRHDHSCAVKKLVLPLDYAGAPQKPFSPPMLPESHCSDLSSVRHLKGLEQITVLWVAYDHDLSWHRHHRAFDLKTTKEILEALLKKRGVEVEIKELNGANWRKMGTWPHLSIGSSKIEALLDRTQIT